MSRKSIIRAASLAAAATAALATPAAAEFDLTAYTGWQTAPHSRLTGTDPAGNSVDALIGWEGRSFELPPYWGLRGTWWQNEHRGIALELTHAKVVAPENERNALGFSDLEFTDGHNVLTVNYARRWPEVWGKTTAFASVGAGVAIPHVDIDHRASGSETLGYQLSGPAMRLTAGVMYPIADNWSLTGEYQFTYSDNKVELDGGGDLSTVIKTNAINVGVTYHF